MLVRLEKALGYIDKVLEDHPVEHPDAMRTFNSVRFGVLPTVRTPCEDAEDGKTCVIHCGTPCGGLDDLILYTQEAVEVLSLEVEVNLTERQALDDTEGDEGDEEEAEEVPPATG